LELSNINVECTIKPQGSSQGRDHLGNKPVKVGVSWALNVKAPAAYVVQGFVVKHNGNIGVFQKRVSGKHAIVWLNDSGGNLWRWVDAESEFGFAAVVNGKAFQKEGAKSRSSSSSNSVEAHETLETSAVVSQLADPVKDKVYNFFTDGVVTTGVVVGSIFLSGDDLLWVVQLSVSSSADFVTYGWFKVDQYGTWDVFSCTSFREKGVEGIVTTSDGFVGWHLTVWLNTVLEAVELPASVTDLYTGLSNMN